MPINIPTTLPATQILKNENIFVISEDRAVAQDIRPLKILILNLMPTKIITETQLLRLIGNTPIQVDIELINTKSHVPKNTPPEHLFKFYKTFEDIKHEKFDGMIITGAPVEKMNFEDVDYWDELVEIMEWSKHHVFSTFHICWGAQAALYYHYNIGKQLLDTKMFGVYPHYATVENHQLLRGFDDIFYIPHSRHTKINEEQVHACSSLNVLAYSSEAGTSIIEAKNGRQIFALGHSEYDRNTLKKEYDRDIQQNLPINIPINYYKGNNPNNEPMMLWKSTATMLFSNWLNYYVYQSTPYDLEELNNEN